MRKPSHQRSLLYAVQPGDDLVKIKGVGPGYPHLLDWNPQLSPTKSLYDGDLVFLPTEFGFLPDRQWAQELEAAAEIWKRASLETRRLLLGHFDLIDKVTDFMEFGERFPSHSLPWVAKLPQYTPQLSEITETITTMVHEHFFLVREQSIQFFQRFSLTIRSQSVLVVEFQPNSYYSLARKLEKMVEAAEKIRFGRALFWVDVGLQVGKVGVVVLTGGGTREILLQIARGVGSVGGGFLSMMGAGALCVATVELGPPGWALCGAGIGTAAMKGSQFGEKGAELVFQGGEALYEGTKKKFLQEFP